jgi:GWxTD domain-containing protein
MKNKLGNFVFISFLCTIAFGMINCGGAQNIAVDPDSADSYEMVRLIMTKEERDIFRHLPDVVSKEEFIQEFWLKRDLDPDTEENEFKEEFFARIDYANKHFREGTHGWKTDRGRIYVYLGPPDRFDETYTNPNTGRALEGSWLVWIYYRYNLAILFISDGYGHYTLDPSPADWGLGGGVFGSLTEAIDMARLGISFEAKGDFSQKYVDFDARFDKEQKEIVVSIPVKLLEFLEEGGLLKADLDFEFHVYKQEGSRVDKFNRKDSFAKSEDEVLQMKELLFRFPYDLKPGKYYLDVIIIGEGSLNKTRKIFKIKI